MKILVAGSRRLAARRSPARWREASAAPPGFADRLAHRLGDYALRVAADTGAMPETAATVMRRGYGRSRGTD